MIRNLREDEVTAMVRHYVTPAVLEARGTAWSEALLADIACYILNRVGPRYVTSERGLNYFHAEATTGVPADLLALMFECLDHLQRMSRAGAPREESGYWYRFPVYFGRILDGATLLPLEGARVECLLDGERLRSKWRPFENPYTTHRAPQGVYSFWPDPLPAGAEKRSFLVRITAAHPGRKTEGVYAERVELAPLVEDPWGAGPLEKVVLPAGLL